MESRYVFTHYQRQPGATPGAFKWCPSCGTEMVIIERNGMGRPVCPACGFVQHRNPAPTVSVLISDGSRVLLGQRRHEPGQGQWALPSGYIEYEEDFIAAAMREAKEETGLDVVPDAIIHVASSFVSPRLHFLGLYIASRVAGGAVQAGDDLEVLAWYPLGGPLPEMAFAEDMYVIALAQRGDRGLPVAGSRSIAAGDQTP